MPFRVLFLSRDPRALPSVLSCCLPLDLTSLRGSRRATPMSLHRSLSRSSTRTASAPFSYIYAHSTALGSRPAYTFLPGDARQVSPKSGEQLPARGSTTTSTGTGEERRTCFPRARRTGWTATTAHDGTPRSPHSDDMPPARRQRRLASRRPPPLPSGARRREATRARANAIADHSEGGGGECVTSPRVETAPDLTLGEN